MSPVSRLASHHRASHRAGPTGTCAPRDAGHWEGRSGARLGFGLRAGTYALDAGPELLTRREAECMARAAEARPCSRQTALTKDFASRSPRIGHPRPSWIFSSIGQRGLAAAQPSLMWQGPSSGSSAARPPYVRSSGAGRLSDRIAMSGQMVWPIRLRQHRNGLAPGNVAARRFVVPECVEFVDVDGSGTGGPERSFWWARTWRAAPWPTGQRHGGPSARGTVCFSRTGTVASPERNIHQPQVRGPLARGMSNDTAKPHLYLRNPQHMSTQKLTHVPQPSPTRSGGV